MNNMNKFKIGDIVARKSYGGDLYFRVAAVIERGDGKTSYLLKGLVYRLEADSYGDDLVRLRPSDAHMILRNEITIARKKSCARRISPWWAHMAAIFRARPGSVLHLDGSADYLEMCIKYYREASLNVIGKTVEERKQPEAVGQLIRRYQPDILVVTGHDAMKKGAGVGSIDNYKNSRYFIESVREARRIEASLDRLCIFAGACQSFFEAIMDAGANFASSPGRIMINALDPAIVSKKIALTDSRITVTPEEIAQLTVSGSEGIGGVNTRGRLKTYR